MLILLTAEQLAANWDFIKEYVIESCPLELTNNSEERTNNILNGLLLDELQCWVEATSDDSGFRIVGIIITQILYNYFAGVKNLLIYSLIGIDNVFDIEKWERGLLTLVKFARKKDCQNIIAYSNNARVIKLAERFKANTSQRLIVFNLTS